MALQPFRTLAISLLFSSSVIGGGTPVLFPKAVVRTEDVEAAIKTEWDLRKNYDLPPEAGGPWFSVIEGTSTVLISAPHATAHIREGKSRFADAGTGALAVMLNKLARTTVIYTTRQSPSDPNFYDHNEYKTALSHLIDNRRPRLVLDLHASHYYRPYDVDFGTMDGRSIMGHTGWLRRLGEYLTAVGVRDFSQDYFPASKDQTVTKFVRGKGVPCVQMELNETWLSLFNEVGIKSAGGDTIDISEDVLRVDQGGAHRFSATLEALVRFVEWIDQSENDGNKR